MRASDWPNKFRKLPHGRGVGLACSSYLSGAGLPIYWNDMPHSGVQLKLDRSGGVTAFCGATEIGQGSDDVLVACVAEVLGIDPHDIRPVTGDTDLTPVDLGSYSSRVTLMMGNAAIQAAERARDLLADAVSRRSSRSRSRGSSSPIGACSTPRIPSTGVDVQGGGLPRRSDVRDDRHRRLVHAAEIRGAFQRRRRRPVAHVLLLRRRSSRSKSIRRPAGSTCRASGSRTTSAARSNPTLVRGQVEGSVYMGLGEALMEEQEFRRLPPRLSHALVHKFPSMLEYKSPTTLDMPEIFTELVEHPDPRGPFGAKEVGQGPLLPIMPAVANAVYDAIGVRIDEVPITPEKIVKALQAKAAGKAPRFGPTSFPDVRGRRRCRCRRRGKAATARRSKTEKSSEVAKLAN